MARYLVLRLVQAFVTILLVLTVVFVISRIAGDPVIYMVNIAETTEEELDFLRQQLGLNDPVAVQYARFMGDALRGDFGHSFRSNLPAMEEVLKRAPASLQLALFSLVITLALSIPLGVIAAVQRGTPLDGLARTLALVGQAAPNFWVGLMLLFALAVRFDFFPTGGQGGLRHLILPGITLGTSAAASLMRLTRSSMLDVLNSDYVTLARAKGLPRRAVIFKHALRNALIPIVTILGLRLGVMISGSVIVETIFSWPGVGRLIITSINNADYPVVQAAILLVATSVVLVNLATDISYMLVDPRIRYVRS